MSRVGGRTLLGLVVSLGLLGAAAGPAAAQPGVTTTKVIVRLKAGTNLDAEALKASDAGGRIAFRYRTALTGFAIEIPQQAVAALRSNPAVVAVDPDTPVTTSGTQPSPPWGLDRIDQRALPLIGSYTYQSDGAGVTAYVIDTGILTTHVDFGGRAARRLRPRSTTAAAPTTATATAPTSPAPSAAAPTAWPRESRWSRCASSTATAAAPSSGVIAGFDWAAANHAAGPRPWRT